MDINHLNTIGAFQVRVYEMEEEINRLKAINKILMDALKKSNTALSTIISDTAYPLPRWENLVKECYETIEQAKEIKQ